MERTIIKIILGVVFAAYMALFWLGVALSQEDLENDDYYDL